jgi:RimJ/RimL family protein N-acetyltransferase
MKPIEPIVLGGRRVRLEPLTLDHVQPLLDAANESRANYGLTHVPSDEPTMRAYVTTAIATREQGLALPFATVDLAVGRVVGSTRFGNIEYWVWPGARVLPLPSVDFEAAEIGWTWLAASAQRTAINTEAKLLMLTHAFETWRVRRVNLKTDARNERSRNAIARIGASFEGILRSHMPSYDGGVRDTALYSILASEWPAAKAALERRLAAA